MPMSNSNFAYHDCLEVFDRALASERGVRIRFPEEGDARYYSMRLQKARVLHRKDNAETYSTDHPLHGRSEYDTFTIKVRPNEEGWEVLLERNVPIMQIEDL